MKNLLKPILLYLIVLAILPDSISAQNKENDQDKHFTMIIASDPQFFIWFPKWKADNFKCKKDADYKNYIIPKDCEKDCTSNDCAKAMAIKTNEWQVNAMNNIQKVNNGYWPKTDASSNNRDIKKPAGVIMNGDLMANNRNYIFQEYTQYRKYYDPKKPDKDKKTELKLPIFPGLGNHDLFFYKDSKHPNVNREAARSVKYIRKWKKNPPSFSFGSNPETKTVIRSHEGSLSYSFDIGGYHFIQLHNYPAYEKTFKNFSKKYKITNSFNWLKKDIRIANNRGQKIVINMHVYKDKSKTGKNLKFQDAIKGKNIVAIFAGHEHKLNGFQENLKVMETSYEIPVFYSGSSLFNTFLLVDFGPSSMTVGVIERNKEKKPGFKQRDNEDKLKTYSFDKL